MTDPASYLTCTSKAVAAAMPRDTIRVNQLRCQCLIGILPHERLTPQPLTVDLEVALDVEAAATTGNLAASIDYSELAALIRFILETGKFYLIESAAIAIARVTLLRAPVAQSVCVLLTKSEALGGDGIPSLMVQRNRGDMHPAASSNASPKDVIFACPETVLALIAPGDTAKPSPNPDPVQDFSFSDGSFLRVLNRSVDRFP